MSFLLAVLVASLVRTALRPGLSTLSVLLIVQPVSHILRTLGVVVGPPAVALIVVVLPLVGVPIDVQKLSHAARLTVIPFPVVLGSVGPLHQSFAVSEASQPLSFINGSRLIMVLFGD